VRTPRRIALLTTLIAAVALYAADAEAKAGRSKARRPAAARSTPPKPPAGFVEMFVAGVMPTPDGHTLFLNDADKSYFIPMGIGATEALSIHLRLERRRYERPLTHDLFDSAMRELGGRVIKVHVDDLRSSVFTGTVFIQDAKGRLVSIDSRPSDAIALALGNRVPIFVSKRVVEKASIATDATLEDLPDDPAALPESMPRPGGAEKKPISL